MYIHRRSVYNILVFCNNPEIKEKIKKKYSR